MSKQKQKRQFKGTKSPRLFFDRRVRATGNTRSISLGKLIPESWYYVRMEIIDREEDSITIKFSRLLETIPNACDTATCKGCEQNP